MMHNLPSTFSMFFLLLLPLAHGAAANKYYSDGPETETVLSGEDFERAKYYTDALTDGDADETQMLSGDHFEGDIATPGLTSNNLPLFMSNIGFSTGGYTGVDGVMHNAIVNKYMKWTSHDIPYAISSRYSTYSRSLIAAAMNEYAKLTCLRFVPRTNQRNYVYIFPDTGCYSMVGKNGGRQSLSLASGCLQKGIIMHELMHAVGFFHEQSRTDRDSYIDVLYGNIQYGMSGQFTKYGRNVITDLGTQYDYASVMHYGSRAFSANGRETIRPKRRGVQIGQRRGFSQTDAVKINRLYKCDGATGIVTTAATTTARPTTVRPSATTTRRPPTGTCQDRRSDCHYLEFNFGYCRAHAVFMVTHCCHTCEGKGSGGKTTTRRRPVATTPMTTATTTTTTAPPPPPMKCGQTMASGKCEMWMSKGLCRGTFLSFMMLNCGVVCGHC